MVLPEPGPVRRVVSQFEPEKDPERVARGRLGGARGGKLRAEKLTPERRAEIARKAAAARWTMSET